MDTKSGITCQTEVEIILQYTKGTTHTGLQEPVTSVGCPICPVEELPIIYYRTKEAAIKIKQTMPMRKDLHEYFVKDYNLDLKIWEDEK